jgi:hypothetical protein
VPFCFMALIILLLAGVEMLESCKLDIYTHMIYIYIYIYVCVCVCVCVVHARICHIYVLIYMHRHGLNPYLFVHLYVNNILSPRAFIYCLIPMLIRHGMDKGMATL